SFRPSYNMAVNLVRNYTPDQAHELLNASFAQFLADRGVVALERAREQDRVVLEGYRQNLRCDLGDFDEYWGLVQRARVLRDEDRRGREAARAAVRLEAAARAHPCHGCPERAKHERWAEHCTKLEQQMAGVERRIRVRTETLARRFDRVLAVLTDLGYVRDWSLTSKGRTLTRIYGEGDLLVGEALATGLFDGLEPSEVASLVSTVVYEAR